jgi:hypothetical protein
MFKPNGLDWGVEGILLRIDTKFRTKNYKLIGQEII